MRLRRCCRTRGGGFGVAFGPRPADLLLLLGRLPGARASSPAVAAATPFAASLLVLLRLSCALVGPRRGAATRLFDAGDRTFLVSAARTAPALSAALLRLLATGERAVALLQLPLQNARGVCIATGLQRIEAAVGATLPSFRIRSLARGAENALRQRHRPRIVHVRTPRNRLW